MKKSKEKGKEKGWLRKAKADMAGLVVPITANNKSGQLSTIEQRLVLSIKQTRDSAGSSLSLARGCWKASNQNPGFPMPGYGKESFAISLFLAVTFTLRHTYPAWCLHCSPSQQHCSARRFCDSRKARSNSLPRRRRRSKPKLLQIL
jgi:hypothetical protein